MSKSTPIAQLRTSVPTDVNTIEPPMKQPFPSMQQAQENFMYPQNTQASSDVVADDDATVLDALNHLNQGGDGQQVAMEQQQRQMIQPPEMFEQHQMNPQHMQQMDPVMAAMQLHEMTSQQQQQSDMKAMVIQEIFSWNDDMKTFIAVVVVFFLVTLLPIETFIYKYISLDKIPYSNIIIKAILAGVLVFVIRKLL